MADALDNATELAAEQEREIVRLGEEAACQTDEPEGRGDPPDADGC
jgi:hypothetical protein